LARTVGWVDETFFLYCEDIDYALRCRRAGAKLLGVPAARIAHNIYVDSAQLRVGRWVLLLPGQMSVARVYYGLRNGLIMDTRQRKYRWLVYARYGAIYLMLQVFDLFFGRHRRRRLWARTLALRDALTGRMGRADYPVLRGR
jgi:GT2 family glycosyltransferase